MIRILLVDDEPDLLDVVQRVLERKYGFATIAASSGIEALKIFQNEKIDAIISDYSMPAMNGIELLRRIRTENQYIPFILFTIRQKEDIAIEALNAGANFYVQKENLPQVVFAELSNNIQKSVELFRAERNLKIQRDLALANTNAKSLDETFRVCSDALIDVSGMSAVAFYLNVGGEFIVSSGRNLPDGYSDKDIQADLIRYIKNTVTSGNYIFRGEREILEDNPILSNRENIRSDCFLGMTHHGRMIGIVHAISFQHGEPLSPSIQRFITDIIVQISGYISDRLAEEALRMSENQMSTLIRNLPGMIYQGLADDERTMLFVSEAVSNLTGFKPGEVINNKERSWASFIHPLDRTQVSNIINKAVSKKAGFRLTYRLLTKDNKFRWVSDQGTGVFGNQGSLVGIEGIVMDITKQKALDDQVHKFHTRLKTMFMLMNSGCVIFKSKGTIADTILDDMNSAAEDIEQKKKEDLIGKSFQEIFINTDATLFTALNGMLEDKSSRSILKCVRKLEDKIRYFEISLNIAQMSSDADNYEIFLIYNDVTERVNTEQQIIASLHEKELLLKEVHHRVKNNLQIVSGILKLQSLRIEDPRAKEIIQECDNQVYSMASIHELLYNSRDLGRISVDDYIRRLIDHLKQEYGELSNRLNFIVLVDPKITLDIERCIPCGLILNELIMNAVKYAFKPSEKGDIKISFSIERQNYRMQVEDNGKGLPVDFDIRKTKSLGMELANRLTHQLRGSISFKSDNGVIITILFPKDE